MINELELRLNNIVECKGRLRRVGQLEFNKVWFILHSCDRVTSNKYYVHSEINPVLLTEDIIKKLYYEDELGYKQHAIKKEDGRYGYKYILPLFDYNYVIERDWRENPSHFFGIEYTDAPNPEDDYKPHWFAYEVGTLHRLQNMFYDSTNGIKLKIENLEDIFI